MKRLDMSKVLGTGTKDSMQMNKMSNIVDLKSENLDAQSQASLPMMMSKKSMGSKISKSGKEIEITARGNITQGQLEKPKSNQGSETKSKTSP
jgi:hypothetical protein